MESYYGLMQDIMDHQKLARDDSVKIEYAMGRRYEVEVDEQYCVECGYLLNEVEKNGGKKICTYCDPLFEKECKEMRGE